MKFVILIYLACLAVAFGVSKAGEAQKRINGVNGWYVPQVNGPSVWMSKEEATIARRQHKNSPRGRSSADVLFFLYTLKNRESPQIIKPTLDSIQRSNFNGRLPTRIIIHGWRSDLNDDINVEVRRAWLSTLSCNVISVDWSSQASTIFYPSSVDYVPTVGEKIAELVDFLNVSFDLSFDTLTIIGHSLGAHAAGFAGKKVRNGRVDTIIGLDTALPLFSYDEPKERLSSGDAKYVESIHTNSGNLGFLEPIGQAAFYPNGGVKQPGCGEDPNSICSHSRAYYYYAEAVRTNSYPAIRCPSYQAAVDNDCGRIYSSVNMGDIANSVSAKGIYYVPVHSEAPYGSGPVLIQIGKILRI